MRHHTVKKIAKQSRRREKDRDKSKQWRPRYMTVFPDQFMPSLDYVLTKHITHTETSLLSDTHFFCYNIFSKLSEYYYIEFLSASNISNHIFTITNIQMQKYEGKKNKQTNTHAYESW